MKSEINVEEMRERMDAIRLKQILGSPLKNHELMCLQFEQNGFGCSSCGMTPGTAR